MLVNRVNNFHKFTTINTRQCGRLVNDEAVGLNRSEGPQRSAVTLEWNGNTSFVIMTCNTLDFGGSWPQ